MFFSIQSKQLLIATVLLMLFLILFASSHTVFAYGAENPSGTPSHHGLAPHTDDSSHTECPQTIHQLGVSRMSEETDSNAPIINHAIETVCVREISLIFLRISLDELQSVFYDHPLDQKIVLRL